MKNLLVTGAIGMFALLVAATGVSALRADPGGTFGEMKDLLTTAEESGHFKTFIKAVEAAGLADTLKGKGPFTVFAPSDAAFGKLPKGELDMLLKPENKEKLKGILLTHVIAGNIPIAEVKKMKEAKTEGGKIVEITHHFLTGVHIGFPKDMAHVQNSDHHATNGVLHVLDRVIIPAP